MSLKKGQNPKYEKGFFQGRNSKDGSMFIKPTDEVENKNIARKSKTKRKKK